MTPTERKIAIADAVIEYYGNDSKCNLPPAIASLVCDYNEALREDEANRILEEELHRAEKQKQCQKEKEELKKKYDAIANPVPWADRVPLNERFVVMKTRNRYYQCQELVERDDYCPIDLLRGYTAPYFGYYSFGLEQCHLRIMKNLLRLKGLELWRFVGGMFGFFNLSDKEQLTKKMSIVSYTVGDDGLCEEVHDGPPMTFYEHFKALELKYGTDQEII